MYNHAPENYVCPICLGVKKVSSEATLIAPSDFVYEDELVVALINSFFVPANPGHVIVVPKEHYENLYDMPLNYLERTSAVAKHIALAMKSVRQCDGITLLQNNEPAGGQKAFHSHLHVYPRFTDDNLLEHIHNTTRPPAEERQPYADALKEYFTSNPLKI
jgi:histidine triad (HIT) family protein